MRRLSLGLLLVAAAALVPVSPGAEEGPAKAGKTTIKVTVRTWSPKGGYKALPRVKVLVGRGGARLRPPAEKGKPAGWVSDARGEVTVEVTNGEPVTLVFHMSQDYVPVIHKLAAPGGTHEVGPALITVDDYRAYENVNPGEPRAYTLFSQAARAVPVDEANEEDKQVRKELQAGKERILHAAMSDTFSKVWKLWVRRVSIAALCLEGRSLRHCWIAVWNLS